MQTHLYGAERTNIVRIMASSGCT